MGITQNNIIARSRSVNISPYSCSKEDKRATWHTTMPITKHNKVRQYSKNKAQCPDNTWAIALTEKPKSGNQPRRLCSGATIALLTTSISRICSHQEIDDHRKERDPHHKTYNKQKGKLEQKRIYHKIIYTFTVKYTCIIQACYDLPNNTLRLRHNSSGYI